MALGKKEKMHLLYLKKRIVLLYLKKISQNVFLATAINVIHQGPSFLGFLNMCVCEREGDRQICNRGSNNIKT